MAPQQSQLGVVLLSEFLCHVDPERVGLELTVRHVELNRRRRRGRARGRSGLTAAVDGVHTMTRVTMVTAASTTHARPVRRLRPVVRAASTIFIAPPPRLAVNQAAAKRTGD